MRVTRILWDMPITIEIDDPIAKVKDIEDVYKYFEKVDDLFNTFRDDSEISKINRGELKVSQYSQEVNEIFRLAEKTKLETLGYFDINREGKIDPLGIVKGWAIKNGAEMLKKSGYKKYFVDAGGDIQAEGKNWRVGIRNPFNRNENIKIISVNGQGVATSGTYIRGQHITNPKKPEEKLDKVVSVTVVAENVMEADRFATAAFAMGEAGIEFIAKNNQLAGYMIDKNGKATFTNTFEKYEID